MHRRRHPRCLLQRARNDPDAFGDFYRAYSRRVFVFFIRRVFDAEIALDLTAETFALALQHRKQFHGRTAEEEQGWLFAIARNELKRFIRRDQLECLAMRALEISPEIDDESMHLIERLEELQDLRPRLRQALTSLPADQRIAVELRVIKELDYGEIATSVGVSEQVARARVSRGLRQLAKSYEPSGHVLEQSS
ncbi:MAG: hypothetical protein QOJ29_1514 [Thermoleophilaceae bacterium]|jgi:RNA polymerase sigma-70 factor (ECF subfamily)|nr:hypothetical protein [Thermoleophilaceae bacterium]